MSMARRFVCACVVIVLVARVPGPLGGSYGDLNLANGECGC